MTHSDLTTEEATAGLFKLARRTPFNIAPERAEALALEVFGTGDWTITSIATKADFWAVAEDKAVFVGSGGLASLWCIAVVAWKIIDWGSRASRDPLASDAIGVDVGEAWRDLNLQAYIDYARRLIKKDERWPSGLEVPNALAPLSSPEGRLNNLFFGALSWILLHEIGHVRHGHVPYLPPGPMIGQEEQADDFATTWALNEAGAGLEREFRVLTVVTALAWLFVFESEGGQDRSHPPVIRRFRAAVRHFNVGDRSAALENGSYLLKGLLDPTGPVPSARPTAREAFDFVAARLEVLFPER